MHLLRFQKVGKLKDSSGPVLTAAYHTNVAGVTALFGDNRLGEISRPVDIDPMTDRHEVGEEL
jgi:hypothetical protein